MLNPRKGLSLVPIILLAHSVAMGQQGAPKAPNNPWKTLGLSEDASLSEAKSAYLSMSEELQVLGDQERLEKVIRAFVQIMDTENAINRAVQSAYSESLLETMDQIPRPPFEERMANQEHLFIVEGLAQQRGLELDLWGSYFIGKSDDTRPDENPLHDYDPVSRKFIPFNVEALVDPALMPAGGMTAGNANIRRNKSPFRTRDKAVWQFFVYDPHTRLHLDTTTRHFFEYSLFDDTFYLVNDERLSSKTLRSSPYFEISIHSKDEECGGMLDDH